VGPNVEDRVGQLDEQALVGQKVELPMMSQLWSHEAVHSFQVCCGVGASFGVRLGRVVSNLRLKLGGGAALMVWGKHLRSYDILSSRILPLRTSSIVKHG